MFNYRKREIASLAKENGFRSETLEKVLRLVDVLEFTNKTDKPPSYLRLRYSQADKESSFPLCKASMNGFLAADQFCDEDLSGLVYPLINVLSLKR